MTTNDTTNKLNGWADILTTMADSQPDYAYSVDALRAGAAAINAVDNIRAEMSGKEWSPETIEAVSSIIEATGLVVIEDYNPEDDDDDEGGLDNALAELAALVTEDMQAAAHEHAWEVHDDPRKAETDVCECGLTRPHEHVWQATFNISHFTGTPNRPCLIPGCRVVSLDGDDDE